MSRLYLLALVVIAAAAGLAAAVVAHPGYVLISYRTFRYESGLWSFLALIALVWLAIYVLRVLLRGAWVSGGLINPWSQRHRQRRIRQASRLGQLELAEGRWDAALRHLERAAQADEQPLVHYLGAATAASKLGHYERSDGFLQKALASEPKAATAISLTGVRLLIDRGDLRAALAQAQALHALQPRHPQVLRLLQQLCVELSEWQQLSEILPELRKQKVLDDAAFTVLERGVWQALLEQGADEASNVAELQSLWKRLPAHLRHDPQVVAAYAARLIAAGRGDEAQTLLAREISRAFDPVLVRQYGLLQTDNPAQQLKQAERWLNEQSNQPELLLALGRLSLANQLWGKARSYFEASLRLQRRAETCNELARLLVQLGERDAANALFQEGLMQLAEQSSFGTDVRNMPISTVSG